MTEFDDRRPVVVPASSLPPFEAALRVTLQFEGGYVDDPIDRGGATNMGVTQRTFSAYLKAKGLPDKSVRDMSNRQRDEIYRLNYWEAAKCDMLPPKIGACVFDAAVNHGVRPAGALLQRALWIADDGVIGPKTIAAAMESEERMTVRSMLTVRRELYRLIVKSDPSQERFIRGWNNRVAALWSALYPFATGPATVTA